MLNSIKKYLKKAKEEVSREYPVEFQSDTLEENRPKSWTGVL